MSGDEHDDEFDDIPLQHKRPFGSGLRRGEIKFVPAAAEGATLASSTTGSQAQGQSISDFYLNMVLKKRREEGEASTQPSPSTEETTTVEVCDVCRLPMKAALPHGGGGGGGRSDVTGRGAKKADHHEASIAHQVCLAHSHPPSALDRSRMGLAVLEAQGWDPDSRTGLGAAGQGMHHPIRVKPKDDKLGIGVVVVPKNASNVKREKDKPKLLDAKKVRKMAAEDRRRTDKLQQQIFGKVDLEKYLGSGG